MMSHLPKTFLSIGECMVELSPLRDDDFHMGFAGDTFNSAWYARRLLPADWTVAYGTCVGDDTVSERMRAFIASSGVDVSTIRTVPGTTVGLYMIQLQGGERSFSYWRGQSAARRLADDPNWLDGILDRAGVVLFSGITLAILPPEARTQFCAALVRARAGGKLVVFDPNHRPRLWDGPEDMRAGLMKGASVADIVLPSFDEEAALFGDAGPAATIARYANAGAGLVAVKNGAGPLHVWNRDGFSHAFTPAPAAEVVDTTAAGDSFNAAFLAAHLQGAPLADAVQRGMALSARVVQARGALVETD
ncbi:sugar kinase [Actibacterium sp. MT2.3-13A]|uniref:sugar kinase n=1 Tax=Actibacterium sp. MT2.3-13A TaxID=2828332 RepID=UPI0020128100|nr:sugar kinase [Actibacterium sp. MT2.3-13A]